MHVVFGQQNNNHTNFSTRAISFISSLLMSSDLYFHYHDDLATQNWIVRVYNVTLLLGVDIHGHKWPYLDRLSWPRM